MNLNSLSETITKYEQITGETFYQSPDLALKVLGDSFMLWRLSIRDGVPYFWIDQTFARSFSVFVPFVKEVCQTAEIEWIATATTRNPRAHVKKWKMELVSEYDFENRHYFVLKGHIKNLK